VKFKFRILLGFFTAALILAACLQPETPAQAEAKVKAATASAIGGVEANAIVVSNIERGPARTAWRALTPQGEFDCDADEQLRLPSCNRRNG
jgi:hypothetical protein